MKTQISRISHDPKKRYSGIYQQQGRMFTDADWNELVDIIKQQVQGAFAEIVGDGSPNKVGIFEVDRDETTGIDNGTRKLKWGTVYVGGLRAEVRPDLSATTPYLELDKQDDLPLNGNTILDGD